MPHPLLRHPCFSRSLEGSFCFYLSKRNDPTIWFAMQSNKRPLMQLKLQKKVNPNAELVSKGGAVSSL